MVEFRTKTVKDLLSRGVVGVVPQREVETLLSSRRKLRVKHGVDPTTSDLHLGYFVVYEKLRRLQELGHTIVFLIGDFTGRFGDPTDRRTARVLRSKQEIREKARGYKKQLGEVLDISKTEVRYNSEWYDTMRAEDFLRIFSYFTAQQMLERDMFEERKKRGEGIFLHELLYPALQAYDSVMLKSDLTVIGNDQLFNELQARRLQSEFGQAPQGVIAMKILVGVDGERKMSQSLGNAIGVAESPTVQFGKIMSIPDTCILSYFELLTEIPLATLSEWGRDIKTKKQNPRDLKLRLAEEIVSRFHGAKEAKRAAREFLQVFSGHKLPSAIPVKTLLRSRLSVIELLIVLGLAKSHSDARRLVGQGGVRIFPSARESSPEPITDPGAEINLRDGMVVNVGKRHFIKVYLSHKDD